MGVCFVIVLRTTLPEINDHLVKTVITKMRDNKCWFPQKKQYIHTEESTMFKTTDWLMLSKGINEKYRYTRKWRSAVVEMLSIR